MRPFGDATYLIEALAQVACTCSQKYADLRS